MSGPFLRHYVAARAIIVLAALSLLLYARAVVSLHEYMHSTYDAEIGQFVPAAISHVAHGAPLGFMDRDILKIFDQARSRGADWGPAALQKAVADAVHARVPVGETLQSVRTIPYLDLPNWRSRWLTGSSVILAPTDAV